MIDLIAAKKDPTSVFARPEDVLHNHELSVQAKKEILESWAYDARVLEIAEEENMGGSDSDLLSRILTALETLD